MLSVLLVLTVWVALSALAAAGFCMVCVGARSRGEQDLAAVSAPVPAYREPALA